MTVARGEWLKLATLPAIPLTVALTWAVTGLLSLAADVDPVDYTRAGFVVLGVLAATSEYADGQIRTSLTCAPRRIRLHAVKAGVLALATAPVAAVTVALAGTGNPAHLVLVTVLSAAAGTVVRHALAAVTVLLGYYYAVGPLLAGRVDDALWLPAAWTAGAQALAVVTFARRDA